MIDKNIKSFSNKKFYHNSNNNKKIKILIKNKIKKFHFSNIYNKINNKKIKKMNKKAKKIIKISYHIHLLNYLLQIQN